jgi:hypothetical protein
VINIVENSDNKMNVPIGFKVKYIHHILWGCVTYLSQRNTFTENMIERLYGEDSIKNVPKDHKNHLFRKLLLSVNPNDVTYIKQEFEHNIRLQQIYDLFENPEICDIKYGMFFKLDQASKEHIQKFDHLLKRGELVELVLSNSMLSLSDSEFDLLYDVFRFLMKDRRYTEMLDIREG